MTAQYFYCSQCEKKTSTFQKLFDTLYEFSRSTSKPCPACGEMRELWVSLDFQLGVGDGNFKVIHAFLPEKLESWLGEEDQEVTLYPFLVVLEGSGGKQFHWMPYWHVVGKDARFGQHALCLDQAQFDSLVTQAQEQMLATV